MNKETTFDVSTPQGRRDELFTSIAKHLHITFMLQDVDNPDAWSIYGSEEGEVK